MSLLGVPQRPDATLAEILERPSSLAPVLVTDAKALYDSFHRDGFGTGLTDRRTALEVKVIKEGLQSLGGSLRWHSSERQFADGLTKESTRQLLADRLRHHRLKFTWDPTYQASKRKDLQNTPAEPKRVQQAKRCRGAVA